MKITYLGHQGWAFESRNGVVLFDPIRSWMGNGTTRMPVYPRREIDFDSMPPIQAIVLSHEHSDHFSLETLSEMRFRGPIFIPSLSSNALETILTQLGFSVRRLGAYQDEQIDGLTITALPPSLNNMEIDVFILFVQSLTGGKFITPIDAVPHPQLYKWLAEHHPDFSILNLTNNHVEQLRSLRASPDRYKFTTAGMTRQLMEFVECFKPKSVVLTGQGWCFENEKESFNRVYFNVKHESLFQALKAVYPHIDWKLGQVGEIIESTSSGTTVTGNAKYVKIEESPSREYDPKLADAVSFKPWCGDATLAQNDLRKVETFVKESFGQILAAYAPELTRAIFDLTMNGDMGCQPTLALVLWNGDRAKTYEFRWGPLDFVEVIDCSSAATRYAFGLEMWASDLKLLLNADEEAFFVYEAAVKEWNHFPELYQDPLCIEAFLWFCPRYRPKEYLAAYQRKLGIAQTA